MPRSKTDNIRINLLMPPSTVKALKKLAERRGTSYSELIRRACHDFAVVELTKERAAQTVGAGSTAPVPDPPA